MKTKSSASDNRLSASFGYLLAVFILFAANLASASAVSAPEETSRQEQTTVPTDEQNSPELCWIWPGCIQEN